MPSPRGGRPARPGLPTPPPRRRTRSTANVYYRTRAPSPRTPGRLPEPSSLPFEEEAAVSWSEPADALIIGAGASGGVVALRLAEAGFKVVCLEQGDWLNRADYPGNKLDWELKARKDWATSPN